MWGNVDRVDYYNESIDIDERGKLESVYNPYSACVESNKSMYVERQRQKQKQMTWRDREEKGKSVEESD